MDYLDHHAIMKAYPETAVVTDYKGAFKADGTKINVIQSKVDEARKTLDLEYKATEYKIIREPLYPPLQDFADAMYWNSKGDSTKLEAYYAACEKVKTDNPKPS